MGGKEFEGRGSSLPLSHDHYHDELGQFETFLRI